MNDYVSPDPNYIIGLIASIVTGILAGGSVLVTLVVFSLIIFNTPYVGDVLGILAGFPLGWVSGHRMFSGPGRKSVVEPVGYVGVEKFLNRPTGRVFQNGTHWRWPLTSIVTVPGPEKVFTIDMPSERINARDSSLVFFGVHDPGSGSKSNRVSASVVNPIWFVTIPEDPIEFLRSAFLEQARNFIGELEQAVAVKNIGTLVSEFLMVPPRGTPDPERRRQEFERNLHEAKFDRSDEQRGLDMFSPESKTRILGWAGTFFAEVARGGWGNIRVFTTNARENPELEAAAARKAVADADMDTTRIRVDRLKNLAKGLQTDTKATPNLALLVTTRMSDRDADIKITHNTYDVPDVPEAIKTLGDKVAEGAGKLAEKAAEVFAPREEKK